MELTIKRFISH